MGKYNIHIEERVLQGAELFKLDKTATVRSVAKKLGVSKSTIHKDMAERLLEISEAEYPVVRERLNQNYEERSIRGGQATKQKYLKIKQRKG